MTQRGSKIVSNPRVSASKADAEFPYKEYYARLEENTFKAIDQLDGVVTTVEESKDYPTGVAYVRDARKALPLKDRLPPDDPKIESQNMFLRALGGARGIDHVLSTRAEKGDPIAIKSREQIKNYLVALNGEIHEAMKPSKKNTKEKMLEKLKKAHAKFNASLIGVLHENGLDKGLKVKKFSKLRRNPLEQYEKLLLHYRDLSKTIERAKSVVTIVYDAAHKATHTDIAHPVTVKTKKQKERIAVMKQVTDKPDKKGNFHTVQANAFQVANAAFADLIADDQRALPAQSRKNIAPTAKNAYLSCYRIEINGKTEEFWYLRSGSMVYVGKGKFSDDVLKEDTHEIVEQLRLAAATVGKTELNFNMLATNSSLEGQATMLRVSAKVFEEMKYDHVHAPTNWMGHVLQKITITEHSKVSTDSQSDSPESSQSGQTSKASTEYKKPLVADAAPLKRLESQEELQESKTPLEPKAVEEFTDSDTEEDSSSDVVEADDSPEYSQSAELLDSDDPTELEDKRSKKERVSDNEIDTGRLQFKKTRIDNGVKILLQNSEAKNAAPVIECMSGQDRSGTKAERVAQVWGTQVYRENGVPATDASSIEEIRAPGCHNAVLAAGPGSGIVGMKNDSKASGLFSEQTDKFYYRKSAENNKKAPIDKAAFDQIFGLRASVGTVKPVELQDGKEAKSEAKLSQDAIKHFIERVEMVCDDYAKKHPISGEHKGYLDELKKDIDKHRKNKDGKNDESFLLELAGKLKKLWDERENHYRKKNKTILDIPTFMVKKINAEQLEDKHSTLRLVGELLQEYNHKYPAVFKPFKINSAERVHPHNADEQLKARLKTRLVECKALPDSKDYQKQLDAIIKKLDSDKTFINYVAAIEELHKKVWLKCADYYVPNKSIFDRKSTTEKSDGLIAILNNEANRDLRFVRAIGTVLQDMMAIHGAILKPPMQKLNREFEFGLKEKKEAQTEAALDHAQQFIK